MACEGLVLLKKPQIPLKEWILTHHQVTRVYFVPPGESREVLAGLLAVSVLISMCIMFSMWSTNPICRLQDTCQEGCRATGACPSGTSPYNFTTNIWMKPTTQNSDWDRCLKTAINWRAHPGNPDTDLVCFFPTTSNQTMIACLQPLQGNACDQEKKYMSLLTGASAIVVLIGLMAVPRTIETILSIVLNTCCSKLFLSQKDKTFKGISLGVFLIAGLAVLVVLLVINGGIGFMWLRFWVFALTWAGGMLFFEPLACVISYYLIRCETTPTDEEPDEKKPLFTTGMAPSFREPEASPLSIERPPTLPMPEDHRINSEPPSQV